MSNIIKKTIGIRRRIVFIFLSFSMFVILSSFFFSHFWLSSFHGRTKENLLKQGYNSVMLFFDSRRILLEAALQVYSENPAIRYAISAEKQALPAEFIISIKDRCNIDGVIVLDETGRVKVSDNTLLSSNFNKGLANILIAKDKLSGFWHSGDDRLWYVSSAPLVNLDDKIKREGTLIFGFLIDSKLESLIGQKLGLSVRFFHDSSFFRSASSSDGWDGNPMLFSWRQLQYNQQPFMIQKEFHGGRLLGDALLRDVVSDPVGILRVADYEDTKLFFTRDVFFLIWVIILFFVLSFLFVIKFLTSRITLPLVRLRSAINDVSKSKDLSKRLIVHSEDEVGALILEFNAMLDSLEKMNKKVKNSSEEMSLLYSDLLGQKRFISEILAIAPSIVLMLLPDGRIKYVNEAIEHVTGFKTEECLGKLWFEQFIPFAYRNQVRVVFDEILRGNIDSYRQCENNILTKGGKERLILWNNSVLKDASGGILAVVSVGQDVTELKQMQSELLKKISDLERFYRVTMDREKTILRLKEQINELKSKGTLFKDPGN